MKQILLTFQMIIFSVISYGQNAWITKAPFPFGERAGSCVFGINNNGYLFGGVDASLNVYNDLWMYNPITNQWTQIADLPGPGRFSAASCVIGNSAYIGTGYDNTAYYNDWWEYNSISNTWYQKTSFPGVVRYTSFCSSAWGKAYLGLGKSFTWYSDWYEYDPIIDSWSQKADFPG